MRFSEQNLFLVVLGGKNKSSNVELHDVRWVSGRYIEETFSQLRKEWFGEINGLHIDSYMKINFIDGYLIKLKQKNNLAEEDSNNINKNNRKINYLWFVNLGGYNSSKMSEEHEFGLVVAKSSKEAKEKAKENWLGDRLKKHTDNVSSIKSVKEVDDCILIKEVNKFEIELIPDKYKRSQLFIPDWFGYLRIDNI